MSVETEIKTDPVETSFHNVTITIVGEPTEAYAKLSTILGVEGVEFFSDSFNTNLDLEERDTDTLWPL